MAPGTPVCTFCGSDIKPDRDYRRVKGFVRKRDQGGPNALRLREPLDVWACMFCIERESRGVSAQQQAFV